MYQVISGDAVRGTGDPQSQQRFLNEVKYVDYYARLIGDCLGMRTLDLGVVEDADSQTAFYHTPSADGQGPLVNGFLCTTRRRLTQIMEELRQEH